MVTFGSRSKKAAFLGLLALAAMMAAAPLSFAAEGAAEEGAPQDYSTGTGLRALGLAVGAGIAIAGAGLATARAQAAVGAGGTGAITEKPELFINVLTLFAIPETIVVFGFVIAIMLVRAI